MSNMTGKINAVVAPKKKTVSIFEGKKFLKKYSFKQEIPFEIVAKEVHRYDYGAWSVSDRDFSYMKDFKVYDETIIEEIKQKALDYHLSRTNK